MNDEIERPRYVLEVQDVYFELDVNFFLNQKKKSEVHNDGKDSE